MWLWQILDKTQKDQKNSVAPSEEPGVKAKYCAYPLYSTPPKVEQNTQSIPLVWPLDPHLTSLYIRSQLVLTQGASKQGTMFLVLIPHWCSRGPSKALPEFFVCPLINFYWLLRLTVWEGHKTIRNISLVLEGLVVQEARGTFCGGQKDIWDGSMQRCRTVGCTKVGVVRNGHPRKSAPRNENDVGWWQGKTEQKILMAGIKMTFVLKGMMKKWFSWSKSERRWLTLC